MMKSKQKIGILGGTFNPIHLGHLILGQSALETYSLSKVLFVPCARPPHKDTSALQDAAHRLAMVRAAIEDSLFFEASDIEIQRGGPSYAVETVSALRDLYPEAELYFIIGADTLKELYLWKEIYSLLALCTFISFARPGHDPSAIRPADLHLDHPWAERLLRHSFNARLIEISSSEIRYRVAEGLSICYLVPKSVEIYIAEHGLYGGG
jgi:nicotinate-nucleotide adenylyltransferase